MHLAVVVFVVVVVKISRSIVKLNSFQEEKKGVPSLKKAHSKGRRRVGKHS
jgi:hypothetical protein